jgi:hypothetical protein
LYFVLPASSVLAVNSQEIIAVVDEKVVQELREVSSLAPLVFLLFLRSGRLGCAAG